MSNGAQAGGGSEKDNSLDFLWGIVLIVAAALLIWYFGREYIATGVFYVRLYEIYAINFILGLYTKAALFLHIPWIPDTTALTYTAGEIQGKQLAADWSNVHMASNLVGEYLRYPFAIILAVCAFIVYNRNVTLKFKNIFDMKRLFNVEKENWPQITPVSKLDLVKEDIEKGPWAMAATPMRFARKKGLIEDSKVERGKRTAILDRSKTHKTFALQLGALWHSPETLPIHTRMLYAVFAATANRDRQAADKLLQQVSRSSADGKLNFADVDELLDKYKNTKLVRMVEPRHAYQLTVMASMLELARTDGVFACSDFLWLKPIDRRLWYILNSMGRQTAVPEVAGPFAHWLAEKELGRAMQTPMVEEAVKGLEVAMADLIYELDEDE